MWGMYDKCTKLCTHIGGHTHTVLHSRTAGQLTWKPQNAPRFLTAGALPRNPLRKLTALPQTPKLVGRGCKPPVQEPGGPGSALRASSFGPLSLASPPQCWFRSDATATVDVYTPVQSVCLLFFPYRQTPRPWILLLLPTANDYGFVLTGLTLAKLVLAGLSTCWF